MQPEITQSQVESLPPHNIVAEQCLLGAMLLNHSVATEMVSIVKADAFYRDAHSEILIAILSCLDKNISVDVMTVKEQLTRRNKLDYIGDYGYLIALVDAVPRVAHAEHYAKIVNERYLCRRMDVAGQEIRQDARFPPPDVDAFDLLALARQRIDDILDECPEDTTQSISAVVDRAYNRTIDRYEGRGSTYRYSSGFEAMDILGGGIGQSSYFMIAARPKVGKTALALRYAWHLARFLKIPVLYKNMEMSADEMGDKLICDIGGINSYALQAGRLSTEEWSRFRGLQEIMHEVPIYFDDSPNTSIQRFISKCRVDRKKRNIGCVFIDHVGLMSSDVVRKGTSRYEELTGISKSIRGMTLDLKIPAIVLCQLNRSSSKEHRPPELYDLRDTGAFEQDGTQIWMLDRPLQFADIDQSAEQEAWAYLRANRSGDTGKVKMVWTGAYARWQEANPLLPDGSTGF